MTHVDHHYLLNCHAANAPISHPYICALLPGRRLNVIEHLIPFWVDNSYTRDLNSLFPAATVASYSVDPHDARQWIRASYRELAPSTHSLHTPLSITRSVSIFFQPMLDDPDYDSYTAGGGRS
jgi:hypothetical protein